MHVTKAQMFIFPMEVLNAGKVTRRTHRGSCQALPSMSLCWQCVELSASSGPQQVSVNTMDLGGSFREAVPGLDEDGKHALPLRTSRSRVYLVAEKMRFFAYYWLPVFYHHTISPNKVDKAATSLVTEGARSEVAEDSEDSEGNQRNVLNSQHVHVACKVDMLI